MSLRRGSRLPALLAATGAAALVGSFVAVRREQTDGLDEVATALVARTRNRTTDPIVAVATDVASIYGLAGMSATLLAARRRYDAVDVAAAGLAAWTAAQAIKPLLPRSRPYESTDAQRRVSPPAGSSWPSGHAAVAVAVVETLAPRLGPVGRLAARVGAAAVGLSRLHVGVHHLTDVVAGWGLGALCAAAWRVVRWRSEPRR